MNVAHSTGHNSVLADTLVQDLAGTDLGFQVELD